MSKKPTESAGKITRAPNAGNEGGAGGEATVPEAQASVPVADIIAALVAKQHDRRVLISQISRADRATESLIVNCLSDEQLPKGKRKKAYEAAKKIRLAIERGNNASAMMVSGDIQQLVMAARSSRDQFDRLLEIRLEEMEALAKQLPIYARVKDIRGFGPRGLAVIVGEAGDIGRFATDAKFRKYLCMAFVTDDEGETRRQGNWGKGASAETKKAHVYNPTRRAQIWQFLDFAFVRAQARLSGKDENTGEVIERPVAFGPWGEMFLRKRAEYVERGFDCDRELAVAEGKKKVPPSRATRAARRYVGGKFLRHLWRQWQIGQV